MFGKTKTPLQKIAIEDTLFGDLPLDYWAATGNEEVPWSLFKEAKQQVDKGDMNGAIKVLEEITALPALESRQYLQAYHFLTELGVAPPEDLTVFGIVVEVGMPGGVDLLAVYADHAARYYNFSGRSLLWNADDKVINDKIDSILFQAITIVQQIGPWKEKRRPAPTDKVARISFLTSQGLHFGEAAQAVLFNDPLSKKIMYSILELRDALIYKTTDSEN